jgi:nitrous oxidase accessory protein NosD/predicted secreted protein
MAKCSGLKVNERKLTLQYPLAKNKFCLFHFHHYREGRALKKAVCAIILTMFFAGMFVSAFNIKSVKSTETPQAFEWYKTYGGTGNQEAYGVRSLIQTGDGGYALVGWTTSYGANPSSYEGQSAWLVKTDAYGNVLWNRTYDGNGFASIIQTNDGGYALAGSSWNQTRGACDLYVVKTDANGNTQWNLTYIPDNSAGSLDWGCAYSIIQTSDGGYMIAGSIRHHPDHPTGDWDGWLVKLNANGTVAWNKPYGTDADDGAHDVIQTSDGGYVFVGTTDANYGSPGMVWLAKVDANGSQLWTRAFGGSENQDGWSIAKTPDGGYIIGASTSSFGAGGWDFWLIKTDSNGTELWNKTYGGTNDDYAWSVIATNDGGYALAGYTKSFGAGGADVWLVKTDSAGNQEWNETFGGANDDEGTSVIQTSDGGYAVAGFTNSFDNGSYDVLLLKLMSVHRTITVPDDYPTIQDAINAANAGDTIFVRAGTYSAIMINKSLTLEGANEYTTIIDGGGAQGVYVGASNVSISNFTIQNGVPDVYIGNREPELTSNITVTDNIMKNSQQGVIRFVYSTSDVLTNNFINGTWTTGVGFDWTNDSIICNNTIIGGGFGAIDGGYPSYNNTFSENAILGTSDAVFMNNVFRYNRFFHNNFFTTGVWLEATPNPNYWDNGYPSGGNYWSNYNGTDLYSGPYQNITGSDGIGDTPHIIDSNNVDRYPLMAPFETFNAGTWNNVSCDVSIVSNSTLSNFSFNPTARTLDFNANGTSGTIGFCKVTIPKTLMSCNTNGQWTVTVSSEPPLYLNVTSDANCTYVYFTYHHSTDLVQIQSTNAVSEFQPFVLLPLFMIITLLVAMILKRKRNVRRQES